MPTAAPRSSCRKVLAASAEFLFGAWTQPALMAR
jgi:hypothetical protein